MGSAMLHLLLSFQRELFMAQKIPRCNSFRFDCCFVLSEVTSVVQDKVLSHFLSRIVRILSPNLQVAKYTFFPTLLFLRILYFCHTFLEADTVPYFPSYLFLSYSSMYEQKVPIMRDSVTASGDGTFHGSQLPKMNERFNGQEVRKSFEDSG